MNHDDKLRDKLTTYIQDMYAVENQLVETLDKQVDQAAKFPAIQAKISQHLEATKQHRSRMEQRLQAYGESPSTLKGIMSGMMGNITGAMSGMRSDVLAMYARDDYVAESLEVAGYRMLIATARAYGDEDTVRAAELNLRDDEEMQRWLGQHAAEAALLSLEQDGITIPADARARAQQPLVPGAMGTLGTQPEATPPS